MAVDEVGRALFVASVPLLHPEEQTVTDMPTGWRNE